MTKSKLAESASLLMVITILSKVIGFLRDTLVASSFGATYQTDAYNMAITIPEILFAIFSLAITTTFIPIFSETYKKKGKEEFFCFANNVMNLLLIISIVLCMLGWIFAPQLVRFIAPRFTGVTYELTIELTRISVFNIIFMSMNGGYTALLQTMDDFLAPSLVGIMLNMPIILYIILGAKGGVLGLTIATLIGNMLRVLIQFPWMRKHGYRYRFSMNIKDPRIKRILALILPVVIGAGANQINAIVDRSIGSGLPEGSISALNFASRITDVVYATFATAIVTVIYPVLSREGTEDSYDNFKFYIKKAVNNINIIMIPSAVGLIILSTPIIILLFKHGIFDDRAVGMTSIALIYYSVGIPFYGIRDVFNRGLYALKDTKTSTFNGIIGVGINIILNLILVRFMGIGGLALSTSIAAIVCTFLLMNSLRKKVNGIKGKEILISTGKISLASVIMGLSVYISYLGISKVISGNKGVYLALLISIVIGIIVYTVILLSLKIEEAEELKNMLKSKIKRG